MRRILNLLLILTLILHFTKNLLSKEKLVNSIIIDKSVDTDISLLLKKNIIKILPSSLYMDTVDGEEVFKNNYRIDINDYTNIHNYHSAICKMAKADLILYSYIYKKNKSYFLNAFLYDYKKTKYIITKNITLKPSDDYNKQFSKVYREIKSGIDSRIVITDTDLYLKKYQFLNNKSYRKVRMTEFGWDLLPYSLLMFGASAIQVIVDKTADTKSSSFILGMGYAGGLLTGLSIYAILVSRTDYTYEITDNINSNNKNTKIEIAKRF